MKIQISLSATPVLYHVTGKRAALSVIQKNRFELKPSDGTGHEETISGGGKYYLSTTRSKVGSYSMGRNGTHYALIVLDGTKLATRFKIAPINYWGGYPEQSMTERTKTDEAEDRVFSAKPFIENARKYIKEIHAHSGRGDQYSKDDDRTLQDAIMLKRACLINHIPVFFYDDAEAFQIQDKRKAVDVPLSTKGLKIPEPYVEDPKYSQLKMKARRQNKIRGWIELATYPLKTTDGDEIYEISKTLSEYARMNYATLRSGNDRAHVFNADVHNAKSQPYESERGERESLDKLVALLRKRKQNTKQFLDALFNKWYPPQPKYIVK